MSGDTRKAYPFPDFEPRWQARWQEEKTFRTLNPGDAGFDPAKPKFYALDMFPYPSGNGLHVGHPEGYTATDIVSRTKRKQGFNVLHPMGWDAFGLPAEQYAIKTGTHPRVTTEANVANFTKQLKSLGFAYDWDREVNTTDPGYFKWTQWIFLQLYHSYVGEDGKAHPVSELEAQGLSREEIDAKRLAYVSEAPVNWCPALGTVLANEEVIDGKSEVGGHPVERRPMRQWMLRITAYAQRLIDELDGLDWPESIKLLQRNWIGRSEGAHVRFAVADFKSEISDPSITVFTTRPDTLFGATYMVLAPEHPLVPQITTPEQKAAVEAYQQSIASKSDLERTELAKEKSGVFTGAFAVNPVNDERIPIWIADYVLLGYGTGAIMAVPAHDERDFEFAQKFALPIREVVVKEGGAGILPARDPLAEGGAGILPARDTQAGGTPAPPSQAPAGSPTPYFESGAGVHSTKRRLPHWQQGDKCYFVTWRLADSLPAAKLADWRSERTAWLEKHPGELSEADEAEYHRLFSDRIEEWLDAGEGSCVLADQAAAEIVARAILHFDGTRCEVESFVVMPNHVHVAFRLAPGEDLSKLLHSWKSFTAKEINKATGRDGVLWQDESFDRIVRSQQHWERVLSYIVENPAKARLKRGQYCLWSRDAAESEGGAGILPARDTQAEAGAGASPACDTQAGGTPAPPSGAACFAGGGFAVNSGFLDGLPTAEAKKKITAWLEEKGLGKGTTNFKLRDWLFSRQRYWGEPFPIVWENGQHRAIPESELPLVPPDLDDFKPTGTPEPPLSKATDWVRYSETARRELNTMPQWAGSCWYYLRYCDARNTERFVSEAAESYWMGGGKPGGVDLYVGGTEHAVLHLLYARFWHKVLFDLGHVSTPEPFQRLVNQGLIMGEDGQKMSKSRGNVVNPDDVVREYGADSLRLFEMFMGPLEQVKPWSTKGVEGVYRFLARVWRLVMDTDQEATHVLSPKLSSAEPTAKTRKVVHETIKKVTQDVESLSFNTAISQMMVCTNELTSLEERPVSAIVSLLHVLNPFAPHLTEELYARLAAAHAHLPETQLALQPWPAWDEAALVESEVEIVIQINGKVRDKFTAPADSDNAALEAAAKAQPRVQELLAGLTVRKVIVVPKKLVNIVATA